MIMVAIGWIDFNAINKTTNWLDSYTGIRTYEKDKYDRRLGFNLPYFQTAETALEFMLKHPGKCCQVDLDCVSRFGIQPKELSCA